MWIRCSNGELLNSNHVRSFKVGEATQVVPRKHIDGTRIIRDGFPDDGWLLVAQTHCPQCLARYETAEEAVASLEGLYTAIAKGTLAFEL